MTTYLPPKPELWTGRMSGENRYIHEIISCIDLDSEMPVPAVNSIIFLGYACDEGVKRNHGRPGTAGGADALRLQIGKLPAHFIEQTQLLDGGTIVCTDTDLESAQAELDRRVSELLRLGAFPILLGGGHDIAYGHYNGIKKHIGQDKTIGIINFDAHFDLRNNENGNNSGTPFYQIAMDCLAGKCPFEYLCLGIREDANDSKLFETALQLEVDYIKTDQFSMHRLEQVKREIKLFADKVDFIYVTVDLDGFSSAYAPGVSAASPMGFSPDIVLESLKVIAETKKLISMDIAELNPAFDRDDQTAKLAASLVHFIIHKTDLL